MSELRDLLESAPAWRSSAACIGMDSNIFFLDYRGNYRQARAICQACPVRTECLDSELAYAETWGMFGGLSPRERREIRFTRARRSV